MNTLPETKFVARQKEMAQLQEALQLTLAGRGQVVFITGEAGSGKTALGAAFSQRAQELDKDLLVAVGNCNIQTGAGDPYLPFRQALSMLLGVQSQKNLSEENEKRLRSFLQIAFRVLVDAGPELVSNLLVNPLLGFLPVGLKYVADKLGLLKRVEDLIKNKDLLDADWSQHRIFEQYSKVILTIAKKKPLVLVVDDLQWADVASTSLFFFLANQLSQARILLVGSFRPDEVARGREGERHPLEKVLAELKRKVGERRVDLDQIGLEDRRQFVDAVLDLEPNRLEAGFRRALFAHTQGNPLFVVELLQDMKERGDLCQDGQGTWQATEALNWTALPDKVEGVVEERIRGLEEDLCDVLRVASVEGVEFTAQVVAQAAQLQERSVLQALSRQLEARHRLVREQEALQVGAQTLTKYQFSHAMIQQYLYKDLGEAERRHLHQEIAQILEQFYAGQVDEVALQLAHHYLEAGIGEKAIPYLIRAGDQARLMASPQEAIGHYKRALALLETLDDYETSARTTMKLAFAYQADSNYPQARQAYQEGFDLWQQAGKTVDREVLAPAPQALRMDWPFMPLSLDPALGGDGDTVGVINQLFSGLVDLGPGLEIIPDVAESWEILEDGARYIFHLRRDVRWSDGVPVTAHDFEYAWKRALQPGRCSPTVEMLYDIKGSRAYQHGEVATADGVGVRALDDHTLQVELEQPTSYFLYLMAFTVSFPAPRHCIERHGETWVGPAHLVGNGPFRLEAWEKSSDQEGRLALARSPSYHGRFKGNVQRVELIAYPQASQRLEAYESDELDVLSFRLMPLERGRIRRQHVGEYLSTPLLATVYIGFDQGRPPFSDPRLRRAFAMAVDRQHYADRIQKGFSFPGTGGFIPPGMLGHSPDIGLPYNVEQARELLAQAGYAGGQGFPALEFLSAEDPEGQCEYIAQQWRENLGVNVQASALDWDSFGKRLAENPPHIFLDTWMCDYPAPDNFLRASSALSFLRWKDAGYQRQVELARRLQDQGARLKIYRQADERLILSGALVPFRYLRAHYLIKPWVKIFPVSSTEWWHWKDVVIQK